MLQDTMLKLFHRIGDFRGARRGQAPFWGWLRQIAVNESLMRLRARRKQQPGRRARERGVAGRPRPASTAAADAAQLQRALDALPDATRSVLWLYHAEGYTHDEIAALMNRTASFSKSQLARGTRRLRQLLEPADARAGGHAHA